MKPRNTPQGNIKIFLTQEALFKEPDEETDADTRVTFLPDNETDLMLGALNIEFLEQGINFSTFENDDYYDEELRHLCDVLSDYKDRLPVLYGEVKKARDLDTLAIINL